MQLNDGPALVEATDGRHLLSGLVTQEAQLLTLKAQHHQEHPHFPTVLAMSWLDLHDPVTW